MNYKGFDENLKCKEFQYEIGKKYEMGGLIDICIRGFHACEAPLEVLQYYPPTTSRFCEVEQSGTVVKSSHCTEIDSSEIKIVKEISVSELIDAHIKYAKSHVKIARSGDNGVSSAPMRGASFAGWKGISSSGHCGVSSSGDYGVSSAGWYGASSAGDYGVSSAGRRGISSSRAGGVSSAGDDGVSSAGWMGVSSSGWRGISSVGDGGVSSSGDCGTSFAGDNGVSASRGSVAVGENGCALVRGNGVKARGGVGSILVICVENEDNFDIKEWKAVVVDGEVIKANTWYTVENGKLIEVGEEC